VDSLGHIIVVVDSQQASELVTIRHFGNLAEALVAKGCLDSAGIECFLADANMAWLDSPVVRGMRLQVSPDDVEAAIALMESAGADPDV
jgi:hypothetical protein